MPPSLSTSVGVPVTVTASFSLTVITTVSPGTLVPVAGVRRLRHHRGGRIDGQAERGRRRAGIAGAIDRRGAQGVRRRRQDAGRVAPGARCVRHDALQQHRAVIDIDRRVCFGRAGER